MKSRKQLRRELRHSREALPLIEQRRAALAVARRVSSVVRLKRGMRIAVYLPFRAELDTVPLIERARTVGCDIFVPVIHRYPGKDGHRAGGAALWFLPLESALKPNRFAIAEPARRAARRIDPRWLDVVFMPLVGFGLRGERLGFGAGFYDQTFSFLKSRRTWKKPRLVGLAYHFQALDELTAAPWDVPLDAVVTDREVHRFGVDRPLTDGV